MVWRPRSSCGSSKHTKLLFSFPILSPTSSTTSRGSTPSPRSPTQGPIHCSHRSGKIGHKGNVHQSDLIFLTYFVSRYFSGFEAEYLFNRVFLLHTSESVPSRPQGLRLPFSVLHFKTGQRISLQEVDLELGAKTKHDRARPRGLAGVPKTAHYHTRWDEGTPKNVRRSTFGDI